VYGFTAQTSVAVARAVLNGDFEAGFETPGRLYGSKFVLDFPGVVLESRQCSGHVHEQND